MKLQLVAHASVIITTEDCCIWTDPWLQGKAFNESWALHPKPAWDPAWLERISHLWISHEHPDHFHIPTLRMLPDGFKQRVRLMFQLNNSDKMWEAFRRFGFREFVPMPHRKVFPLTEKTEVYCHQVGNMDSMLGVRSGGVTLLNVNDAEVNDDDCRRTRHDLGDCHWVLNQFSLAGSNGSQEYAEQLPKLARRILQTMVENHRALGAQATVPMASFMYFCTEDNRYINQFHNKPSDVHRIFSENGLRCDVMYPGDAYEFGQAWDSTTALAKFTEAEKEPLEFDKPEPVPMEKLKEAVAKTSQWFREHFTVPITYLLKPVTAHLPDVNKTVCFSIAKGSVEELPAGASYDLKVCSQPLLFALSMPFGVQTLGVSGRYIVYNNKKNWMRHRILFAMNNAEFYLHPRYFFTRRNFNFLSERLPGAWNQLRYKLWRMKQ